MRRIYHRKKTRGLNAEPGFERGSPSLKKHYHQHHASSPALSMLIRFCLGANVQRRTNALLGINLFSFQPKNGSYKALSCPFTIDRRRRNRLQAIKNKLRRGGAARGASTGGNRTRARDAKNNPRFCLRRVCLRSCDVTAATATKP